MILAGDIGGTKTILALYDIVENELDLHFMWQFASADFSTFIEMIVAFEKETGYPKIDIACFGIAGPIIDGECQTTNLSWNISSEDLKKHLYTEKVHLMNDLEATAYGMLFLDESEFVHLNPRGVTCKANHAVIASGTGLGEGMLYYDGTHYHPIGTEGGHTDFAPQTPQQDALLVWLRKRFSEHVSVERIICGSGIYTIYEFLLESNFAAEPLAIKNSAENIDKSALISKCALQDKDPLCVETLRLFVEIYGAEAGNLALKTMSRGGIYIGGGIAPKILPFLQDGTFIKSFTCKGRFKEMLSKMQVKVSLNPQTALIGAVNFAKEKL